MPEPLWPNDTKIDVFGITGPIWSGKTLFGLTIAPEETLCFDLEKSSGAYNYLPFKRVDWPTELVKKFPGGHGPRDSYEYWKQQVMRIPEGKYSVIMVDPADDLEVGLAEYVKSQCKQHGFQTPEKFTSMAGVFWGVVREEWKSVLTNLASRCQTFVFTTHMRRVWVGNSPTNRWEPKGKSTLTELATIYLELERGGGPCDSPSARVRKCRVSTGVKTPEGWRITNILPERMPEATPDALRRYILNPPNPATMTSLSGIKRNLSRRKSG